MSIKATVNSIPKTRVSINAQKKETIRSVGIVSPAGSRFENLTDIDASGADNNEVLVYDANADKYVIKELPVVNGGTF